MISLLVHPSPPPFGDSMVDVRKAIWRSRQKACTKTLWERQPHSIPVCWPRADQTEPSTSPHLQGRGHRVVQGSWWVFSFLVEAVEAVTWGDSHG